MGPIERELRNVHSGPYGINWFKVSWTPYEGSDVSTLDVICGARQSLLGTVDWTGREAEVLSEAIEAAEALGL